MASLKNKSALTTLCGIGSNVVRPFPKLNGDNSTITQQIKAKFESTFGVDQTNRTPKQWHGLVRTYGLEVVSELEGMSTCEILKRCNESFTTSVKRSLKARH